MKLTRLIKHEYLQLLLTAFILLVVAVFFSAQPMHRATVISCATILWVVGLGFSPHYLKNKQFDKNELILYVLGALVFSICLLSWLTSPYFDGKFKTIEPESRFLLFPLTVIAIRYSGLTFKHLAIALSCGAITYAYITYTTSSGRVQGDENAVTFGNGAMLLVVVSSCLAFFEKNRLLKVLLALAAIGYFYASFRSGTRGSFVAFIPLSLLFFYFMTNKMRVVMITLLLSGAIGLSQTPLGNRIAQSGGNFIDFFQKGEIRNNTGIRLHMWEAAFCLNQEAPWLGLGPHQYKSGILDENRICDVKIVTVQAHSFYFNALATVGYLGLVAMLAFFLFLGKYSWSLPLTAKVTIPAALLTFLSYSITVDLLFHRYMADKHLTLLAILLGLALSQRQIKQSSTT
jgi:O-antigen ligase